MSRRSLLKKHQVLIDADSALTPTSESTDISGIDFIQYQIEVDPTVLSDFEIQFCNDERITSNSIWKPLDFAQATILDGSSDSFALVLIENRGFKHLRLSIVSSSGTGNINAWISGNVRGA